MTTKSTQSLIAIAKYWNDKSDIVTMRSIYLCEQGAKVMLDGERLIVTHEKALSSQFHICKIDSILAFGNINFTTPALSAILYNKIPTTLFSVNGHFKGMIAPVKSKNINLRLNQFGLLRDDEFCLLQAKKIINAKILNQITVIKRYSYNHTELILKDYLKSLSPHLNKIDNCKSISSLLGIEGISTRTYFNAYSKMFRHEIKFEKRNKHPSIDPANALLSFGYVLLTREISGYLETIGFDPYYGFYHQPRYGRLSLALDMVEPFRQPIIDRFVLLLANKKMISIDDFSQTKEGLRLNNKPLKNYLKQYEKWMNRPIKNDPNKCFRKIVFQYCDSFQKAIKEKCAYDPFIFK